MRRRPDGIPLQVRNLGLERLGGLAAESPHARGLGQAGLSHPDPRSCRKSFTRSVRDYAIFLLDPEGRVTHWNEGAARVKGYTEAEALGQHVSLFYPPEQVAAGVPTRQLEEAVARGRSHEENWQVRKGGERFWAEELIVSLREEESGALLGFAKICRDLLTRPV